MKSVLISIQPQNVKNICAVVGKENGKPVYKKRIEVRKTRPNIETPFKCFIYCTQGNYRPHNCGENSIRDCFVLEGQGVVNGKVIGEFVCDRIDEQIVFHKGITRIMVQGYKEKLFALCEAAALSLDELHKYIDKDGKDFETFYGWHISDLKIYDKPKELGEFRNPYRFCSLAESEFCKHACSSRVDKDFGGRCGRINNEGKPLTCPPQSYRYVEV